MLICVSYSKPYDPSQANGEKIEYDPTGRNVKKCLTWLQDGLLVMNDKQANFKARTGPDIGKRKDV